MADDNTSIWRKELSFRRKPKPEGEASADDAATSVWKKEISLRRKKGADADPELPPAEPSIWKKEIKLGRKKAAPVEESQAIELVGVADVEPAPEPAPEPVPLPEPEPEPEPAPGAEVVPLVPQPQPQPAEEPIAPAAEIDHSWLTASLEEISLAPEPDEAVAAGIEARPEPAAEPEREPVLELAVEPAPEPVVVEPEREEATAVVLPPVVADAEPESEPEIVPELDPEPVFTPFDLVEDEPAQDESVPFLKRELSLGRKRRADKPARERKPKRERSPKPEAGERLPFYKRELSLKRKPKEQAPAAAPAAVEPATRRASRRTLTDRVRVSLPTLPQGGGKSTKLVGLKIGGSQLAAARISNSSSPELLQAVREPLEYGVVVGGELRDPDALASALRDFFKKHRLPRRGIRLGIANSRIGVRTFELSGIDDPRQLANAIRFRAQEVLPIPLEEAVLDWQVLGESVNEEGQMVRRILLVVAYRELVDRYLLACRKAGLTVIGIDLEAFALLRALHEPRDVLATTGDRSALVAVSVGHDRSTFAVSDGRICEFTRVLEWGGWAMNVAIARALDLTPSEAEPIKLGLTLTGGEVPEGVADDQAQKAREAARRQIQSFARELVSSLQFYQNQPDSLGIREVVLTGGTAHMPGFAGELERLIGVPVRIGDPLGRVKVSKRVKERDQVGSLAVAIGLGIED